MVLEPGVAFSVYLKGRANIFADTADVPGVRERMEARLTLWPLASRTLVWSYHLLKIGRPRLVQVRGKRGCQGPVLDTEHKHHFPSGQHIRAPGLPIVRLPVMSLLSGFTQVCFPCSWLLPPSTPNTFTFSESHSLRVLFFGYN